MWVFFEIWVNMVQLYVVNGVVSGIFLQVVLLFVLVKEICMSFVLIGNEFIVYVCCCDVIFLLVGMVVGVVLLLCLLFNVNYNFQIMFVEGL